MSLDKSANIMLYPLIPFFVAANITGNDVWIHGPEYNFTGYVNMELMDGDLAGSGTTLAIKLFCRPRIPDILRCQINESNIKLFKPHRDGDINDPRKFGIYNQTFEIKFNERGIDSYIVEKTDPPITSWQLNMIRLIANQLSIGADLSDESDNIYRSFENFTIGECKVLFTITRMPGTNDDNNSTNSQALHAGLVRLENLGKLSDGAMKIQKERIVGDCLRYVDPFFGSRYTLGVILRDVFTKLEQSVSKIHISIQKFESETINTSELYNNNRERLGTVKDTIGLILESFHPAKHPFNEFKNPMIVEMLPDRDGDDKTRY